MADDPTEPTDPEGTDQAPAVGPVDADPIEDLPDEDLPDEDLPDEDLPDEASADEDLPDEDPAVEGEEPKTPKSKKRGAATATAEAESTIVRKRVTSKRVTPKGAAQGVKATRSGPSSSKAGAGDDDFSYSKRYTPPKATYAAGPSPRWVPALMFGLLIVGALVIMLNYMGAFGDAENLRLVIGLAFILGGIITATQYR